MDADEEYFIGALGDAHVDFKRHELQVFQKNLEWLEGINQILRDSFGVEGKIFKRDVFMLRKKNKALVERIKQLLTEKIEDGRGFVAGLFDSEGSVYLSTKSKIPVLDITQCDKGLANLEIAKKVLDSLGIKTNLNGPYKHKHAKRPQYHLRVYGFANCKMFCESIKLRHPEKSSKMRLLLAREQ